MRRREFIAQAAVLAAWPVAARAQQAAPPVIGILHSSAAEVTRPMLVRGLAEAGYVEGRDFTIDGRSGDGRAERLPGLARELVARQVAVIVAAGGNGPAIATMAVTATVPIVFVSGGDPVDGGLVTSLARPGGNVTGVTTIGRALDAKRLDLLHQLLPAAAPVGVLVNPAYADAALQRDELRTAAASVGRRVLLAEAGAANDFDGAIAGLARQGASGVVVAQSPVFFVQRAALLKAVARYKLPAVYHRREFVEDGGLISYATDFGEGYRQAGLYVAHILGGAQPGDLPVLQPAKFEMLLNLKTARELGLSIPQSLLFTADEVIE